MEPGKKNDMKNTIIIILTFLSISLIAQDTEYEDLDFKSLNDRKTISNNRSDFFKLSFLFPEIGGEVGLSKQFSLDFGVKLNPNLLFLLVLEEDQRLVSTLNLCCMQNPNGIIIYCEEQKDLKKLTSFLVIF